jgi:hypothetical protein
MLWAFSIWLESVAILPQLFMLQRTGEAETITTHYLFALGAYRALYIPNWIWRYFTEQGHFDAIAVLAGIVQTVLYSDFFWIYYTKYVLAIQLGRFRPILIPVIIGCYKGRSSISRYRNRDIELTAEFRMLFDSSCVAIRRTLRTSFDPLFA